MKLRVAWVVVYMSASLPWMSCSAGRAAQQLSQQGVAPDVPLGYMD